MQPGLRTTLLASLPWGNLENAPVPQKAQLFPFGMVDRALALVSMPTYLLRAFREAFAISGPQFH